MALSQKFTAMISFYHIVTLINPSPKTTLSADYVSLLASPRDYRLQQCQRIMAR
jgi:hypothetical protein